MLRKLLRRKLTLENSALRTEERRVISGLILELRLVMKLDNVTGK